MKVLISAGVDFFSKILTLIDLSCLPKFNVVFSSHCSLHTILLSVYVMYIYISLMKRQFVVNYITRQIEIPTLLDSSGKSTPSFKLLCPQKNYFSFVFVKIYHA